MEWERQVRFNREETHVYLWLIHVDVWQTPTQYCKAIIFQLNRNKEKNTSTRNSLAVQWLGLCGSTAGDMGLIPVLSRSVMSDSLQSLWTVAHRLLCPCRFSRQEYWSGLPCPPQSLGDLKTHLLPGWKKKKKVYRTLADVRLLKGQENLHVTG